MYRKVLYGFIAIALIFGLPAFIPTSAPVVEDEVTPIGAVAMSGVHLVPPSDPGVVADMKSDGMIPLNATPEQVKAALPEYKAKFAKESVIWPNAKAQQRAVEQENRTVANDTSRAATPKVTKVSAKIFALAVDFSNTSQTVYQEYWDSGSETCLTRTVSAAGPRQGDMIAPQITPVQDNNTVFYTAAQTKNAKFYEKLIFGYAGVGRIRKDLNDPRDGKAGINLKGVTVQDYYDRMAGKGNVKLSGGVFGWVTVDHPEAYYGSDSCTGGHAGGAYTDDTFTTRVQVVQLVEDAIAKFQAKNPKFKWSTYDKNKDGIVDNFWIIHGGQGQESGGGIQGDAAIWSHSSDMRYYSKYPNGLQVAGAGTATTADDIYIGPYTMQPENADTGVFAEEFGHNLFGLPDLYVSSGTEQGSIGFWSIMEAGAWGGYLGGSQPVGMPLWFRIIAQCGDKPCNWQYPLYTRNYNGSTDYIKLGQLESTPKKAYKGVVIQMPPIVEEINNEADPTNNSGGAYSGTGRDDTDILLASDAFTVTNPTGLKPSAQLTFDTYYDIEENWDYGYVVISTDGGTTWTRLADMDGITTNYNPEGNNLGNGITGTASGVITMRFDLYNYVGQSVKIGFRYKTDAASTLAGWWIDNVKLNGELIGGGDFNSAVSATNSFPNWTNSDPEWYVVPTTKTYNNYYLVEWRNDTKYDGMAKTSYITTDSDDSVNLWRVERVPYNLPGALIYYRNTKYSATYTQRPNYADSPSYGPKYQLLLVDVNSKPLAYKKDLTNGYGYFNSRVSSYDAALTLQDSSAFTISKINGVTTPAGPYVFGAKNAVTHFDDARGYYPGFYYGDPCAKGYVCYWNRDGSAVIPASGLYSTRITNFDGEVVTGLAGELWAPSWFGTGNPSDDAVNYGVNIDLISKDKKGTTAVLRFSYAPNAAPREGE